MVGPSIAENLESVREKIRAACSRVNRPAIEVKLIAVSKGQSVRKIQEALKHEQNLFGENYVQEAIEKQHEVTGAHWHFIGQLQSNKAKQVVGNFALIHSVDRESLVREISRRAIEKKIVQDILLEVSLTGEKTKGGVSVSAFGELIALARELPGIRVRGLMGMPPAGTPEQSRPLFRMMKLMLEKWPAKDFTELSMGTSQDFEVAVEEGATLVRVGTDVFGPRELE